MRYKTAVQMHTAGTGDLASRQVPCMYVLQHRRSHAFMHLIMEHQVYVCITRQKLTCMYASQGRHSNVCMHLKTEA
jgi:hypothetical protein